MTRPFRTPLAALLLCSTALAAQAAEIKLAMNGVNDPVLNAEAAFVAGFAEALEGTEFTVTVFPNGTLGGESEAFDQVSQGLLEIDLAASPTLFRVSDYAKGIFLPFLFDDEAHFDRAFAGSDLRGQINAELERTGVVLAGFNMIGVGVGIHTTDRAVTRMEDFGGLRIRALNPEQLEQIEAMGATGTIIAWSEVANAIQTGVADGYLNAPNSALRTGHTEFLHNFTQLDMSPSARSIVLSLDWYEGLSDDERAQIDAALEAGIAANRAWVDAWRPEVRSRQEAAGVTVSELAEGERDRLVGAIATVLPDLAAPQVIEAYTAAAEAARDE
ncbi:TRAP transporter substrate-binding protein [Pararhodobacter sp. CCB-MM2]|uniref:TRAP transporter substrate-binding protein n=1 Tax=Pararhodobacter sp. CCB-MM2 TaxID=1786003 RepID=UPI00082AB042|nr:TRAP transporter substrate-binding protein [Pararhodobacter sp. CCB-MM2]